MLLACLVLAATPFPDALKRPQLARLERFTFPAAEKFDSAWKAHPTEGIPVVRGALTFGKETTRGWFAIWDAEDEFHLVPLVSLTGKPDRGWRAKKVEGSKWKVTRWEETGSFVVEERLSPVMSETDVIPWTYTTTLMASSTEVYAPDAEGDSELLETLKVLGEPGGAQKWANEKKGDDALYARFRHFRPMGTCSMDTTPQEAARLYAELAYARGDLGRFLHLQTLIMGDQFARTAWSSYGEAAHGTESERLLSTGVDVDQFLLGLLIVRPGRDVRLDTWRFARSVREAKHEKTIAPELARLAQSATTDAYTRFRATQALLYLGDAFGVRPTSPEERTANAAARRAATTSVLALELHPVARQWLTEWAKPQ